MRWLVAPLLLAALWLASLCLGGTMLSPGQVADALGNLIHGRPGLSEADAILALRLPRTGLALLAGLGFGVSGALMQAITRNPLADPGLMGVNAGAALAVILGVAYFGWLTPGQQLLPALAGALGAGLAVQAMGRGAPLRLTLAGVALSAMLGGLGSAVTLLNPDLFRRALSWSAGSLAVPDWAPVAAAAGPVLTGVTIALFLGRGLNALALGQDVARAQGVRTGSVLALAVAAVTLAAGGATAVAGPLVFVGLIVPHLARPFAGADQARLLALSALGGPVLMLVADITARLALREGELPLAIVLSLAGAPLMVLLARRARLAGA